MLLKAGVGWFGFLGKYKEPLATRTGQSVVGTPRQAGVVD